MLLYVKLFISIRKMIEKLKIEVLIFRFLRNVYLIVKVNIWFNDFRKYTYTCDCEVNFVFKEIIV